MLYVFFRSAVRFGTEKNIGFPRLAVTFDGTLARDSLAAGGCGEPWGRLPRVMFGLAKC